MLNILAIGAVVIVIGMLLVCAFAIDRLYRILKRQSDYIMADVNDKAFQQTKELTWAQRAIANKVAQEQRDREETNRLYDSVFTRGVIDEDSYKILSANADERNDVA